MMNSAEHSLDTPRTHSAEDVSGIVGIGKLACASKALSRQEQFLDGTASADTEPSSDINSLVLRWKMLQPASHSERRQAESSPCSPTPSSPQPPSHFERNKSSPQPPYRFERWKMPHSSEPIRSVESDSVLLLQLRVSVLAVTADTEWYRDTSAIRNSHPLRTSVGP